MYNSEKFIYAHRLKIAQLSLCLQWYFRFHDLLAFWNHAKAVGYFPQTLSHTRDQTQSTFPTPKLTARSAKFFKARDTEVEVTYSSILVKTSKSILKYSIHCVRLALHVPAINTW
jgi:hypothetical protein